MSVIIPAPSLEEYYKNPTKVAEWFGKRGTPEFQDFIKKLSGKYIHWNELLHYKIPDTFSHEDVWFLLKTNRLDERKRLPQFPDKNGEAFSFKIPAFMWEMLSAIDKWGGENITADSKEAFPSKEKYIISSLMDEAIASSQLEGASSTRKVAKEMLRQGRAPQNISERMIVNNWKTMELIRKNRDEKLSIKALCNIQRIITEETLDHPEDSGNLRSSDDIVVSYNNQTVHVPPKADTLRDRLEAFCEFANNDDPDGWIHPIVKAAILHFWIGYDHPFVDGNGRTARAVMYWYLLSRGYTIFEFLSISHYFLRAPGQYVIAYLRTETDGGDLTYFVHHNLKAIKKALENFNEYYKRKQGEMERSTTLLFRFKGLNNRRKSIIYHAIRHPDAIYTFESHKRSNGISYETARGDLVALNKKGFLARRKHGKEYVFSPSPRIEEKLKIRE